MDVSIALGTLLCECARGFYRNKVITFHESPSLVDLNSCETLFDKVDKVQHMPWGGNTNIDAVFEMLLSHAEKNKFTQREMPEKIFIFTDMQFDQVHGGKFKTYDKLKAKFTKAGYSIPKIISWNLRTVDNVGFTKEEENVCLLSGFSTAILSAFLNDKFTPMDVYLDVSVKKKPCFTLLTLNINKKKVVKKYKLPSDCDFLFFSLLAPFSLSQVDMGKLEEAVMKSRMGFKEASEQIE